MSVMKAPNFIVIDFLQYCHEGNDTAYAVYLFDNTFIYGGFFYAYGRCFAVAYGGACR